MKRQGRILSWEGERRDQGKIPGVKKKTRIIWWMWGFLQENPCHCHIWGWECLEFQNFCKKNLVTVACGAGNIWNSRISAGKTLSLSQVGLGISGILGFLQENTCHCHIWGWEYPEFWDFCKENLGTAALAQHRVLTRLQNPKP